MGLTGGIVIPSTYENEPFAKYPVMRNVPLINIAPLLLSEVATLSNAGISSTGHFPYVRPQLAGFAGFGAYLGAAGNCPSPSRNVKGRGCCLDPKHRPPGAPQKEQCCAVSKTRLVRHKNGVSLSCKPSGRDGNGGGGGVSGPGCPSPATLNAEGKCCYGNKCCSQESVSKGSIGWCSGRIMCTAGASGYQAALPGFESYPGKSCGQFPASAAGDGIGGFIEGGLFPSGSSLLPYLIGAAVIGVLYVAGRKRKR